MIKEKRYPKYNPPVGHKEALQWAESMVAQMTLQEKASLLGGQKIFYTTALERLGIPEVLFSDATQGINLREKFMEFEYDNAIDKSTAMPSPILLAATWNTELAYKYAEAIGEECRAAGIPVLLGPGMNIYRISQCGRNFEYFGEDPYLVARMIENYVVGLQKTGTVATLKHFVANNTDYYRRKSNSIVDERSLNEIYYPAFKAGIDAGALAVMTAYNLVHGEWCGESAYVINQQLRDHLGFKWLVMTDWWSVYDGEKLIKSGQDLEMPWSEATKKAENLVKEGKVDEAAIDAMLIRLLKTLYAIKAFDRKPEMELLEKYPKHVEVALQTAREGIVLLKNNGLLPLKPSDNKILLTGPYADKLAAGGGAAIVKGYDNVSMLDALKREFGSKIDYRSEAKDDEIKKAEIVFLSIGTFDSEGWDRSYDLPHETEELVQRVVSLNPNTVVIVNSGSGINMSRWIDKAAAVLYGWYPGQTGNVAMAEILSGKTNPSGKLPITLEKDFNDSPGAQYIPKGEKLYNTWDDAGEKARDVYDVHYNEGVFVGYRWYEAKNFDPLFPFGFGLSYTQFEYSELKFSAKEISARDSLEVIFKVKNTGKLEGAEVAQLYINDIESSVERPVKELKGFVKVNLKPGEEQTASIMLEKRDFSYWCPEIKDWKLEAGAFEILVGASSKDIRLQDAVVLK